MNDHDIATRYANELADLRLILDTCKHRRDMLQKMLQDREAEIESLNDTIRRVHYLTADEVIRTLCESVLLGEVPV